VITARTARMLARYNAWANRLIFDAVAALPPGEATRERKSLFKNMVHTLNHNYVIDRIWQAHLEGREHGYAARTVPREYGGFGAAPDPLARVILDEEFARVA